MKKRIIIVLVFIISLNIVYSDEVFTGSVKCWGANNNGQLGDGSTINKLLPTQILGISNIILINTYGYHSCAIKNDGKTFCWGKNDRGQLGDGTTTQRENPTQINDIPNAISISTGDVHTCAVKEDKTVWCWGYNNFGQLGDGTTTQRLSPVQVSGISNAISIITGNVHSCTLLDDKTIKCWGNNAKGQLGDGTTTNSLVPVQVKTSNEEIFSDVVSISAGFGHTCAVKEDKTVWCWGYNNFGQLGDGTTTDKHNPYQVPGINNIISIGLGTSHTCVLLEDKTIKCWGKNDRGQLGDGTTTQRLSPVQVSGISNAIEIEVGQEHNCAILENGNSVCWGRNDLSQLGRGFTSQYETSPEQISGTDKIIQLTGSTLHTCSIVCTDSDGDSYYSSFCGGDDCDDSNISINPGAIEICGDGADNDCNGLIDYSDPICCIDNDLDGWNTSWECNQNQGYDCNEDPFNNGISINPDSNIFCDCDDTTGNGATQGINEICNNNIDDDCDGIIDEEPCEELTCSDLEGIICDSTEICVSGDILETEDTPPGKCCTSGSCGTTIISANGNIINLIYGECLDANEDGIGKRSVTKNGELISEEECTIFPIKENVPFYSIISLILTIILLMGFYYKKR